MAANVPPYFDSMILAYHRGEIGRFVHLGHWDAPRQISTPVTPPEFARAQARLNDALMRMAGITDGMSVIDIGCGFGGTIEQLNICHSALQITGVNIDPRQLEVCCLINPCNQNQIIWQEADACKLPFASSSVDRVLCIEAMFHFSSRRKFLIESARLLKPGGVMVATDIVVDWPKVAQHPHATGIATTLVREFGPWPELCFAATQFHALADESGLQCETLYDASLNTAPSHDFVAPGPSQLSVDDSGRVVSAANCLKFMQSIGGLKYVYLKFTKPES